MKKLILFLVLIFTTLNVYAKWVLVAVGDDSEWYVKTDSIAHSIHKFVCNKK